MRRILTIGTMLLALGLAATPVAAATVAATAAATAKGGWATTTLDDTVAPAPGETLEVGFTILQHGRTPVNVPDVVVIVHDGASDQRWPAVQEGAQGHYVAEVTFPDSGSYDWEVEQGWFGVFPLGTLHIGDEAASAGAGAGAGGSGWSQVSWPWRLALALPILASVGLFVLGRRRQRAVEPATPVTPASV